LAIRVIDELVEHHAGVGGKIERGAVGERYANLAISSGLDDVAPVNEIPELGLTDASSREIRLNDHGVRMLDGDRTRRSYHLPDRSRFDVPRWRPPGIALRLRRSRQAATRAQQRRAH